VVGVGKLDSWTESRQAEEGNEKREKKINKQGAGRCGERKPMG